MRQIFTIDLGIKLLIGGVVALLIGTAQCEQSKAQGANDRESWLPTPHTVTLRQLSRKFPVETKAPAFKATIPASITKKQREAAEAASQIIMRFNAPTEADTPIEAEYGNERTQAPVVAIVVDTEKSDKTMSAEAFRKSSERSGTLAYRVLSAPRNFGAYAVVIDHWHVNDAESARIKTMQFANVETFENQRVTIAGLVPGVNLFNFSIRFPDTNGTVNMTESTSHVIVVEEVAVLDAASSGHTEGSVTATTTGNLAFSCSSYWGCGFTLTPSLAASKMTVKVQRRGSRTFAAAGLPQEVRVDVGAPQLIGAWEDFADLALPVATEKVVVAADASDFVVEADPVSVTAPGVMVTALGGRRYRVDVLHMLRASGSVTPLRDAWEYRVLVYHPSFATAVDSFEFGIEAELGGQSGDWIAVKDGKGGQLSRSEIARPVGK